MSQPVERTNAPEIDPEELRAVAGRVLGHPVDEVGRYRAVSLGDVAAAAATGGLWRVEPEDEAAEPWSAVLKVVHHSDVGHDYWLSTTETEDPYYWKREALAYSSGLLASLRGGFRGAHCYGAFERGPERVNVWLEDLREAPATGWPLPRFRLAARQLGRAQGEFLTGRPLPEEPWLSRRWFRAYVDRRTPEVAPLPDWVWSHPLVKRAFPEPLGDEALRIWGERERTLALLERLPQTLCHLDVWPRNLFSAPAPEGDEPETVAIDWAYVGIGAVGEDAGNLVPDSMLDFFVDTAHARELHDLVLDGYVEGLADAGWEGDERLPRFGLAATASLKYVWMTPWIVHRALDPERLDALEQKFGLPGEEIVARRAQVMYLLRDLGEEARTLAVELEDRVA